MKFLVVLALVASAYALEDTADVKMAKAKFMEAFEMAKAGKHAALAPAPVATQYLADAPDVAAAKDAFSATFKAAEAGLPVIPAATYTAGLNPYWTGYSNWAGYNNWANWAGYNWAGYAAPMTTYNLAAPLTTAYSMPLTYGLPLMPMIKPAEEMKME